MLANTVCSFVLGFLVARGAPHTDAGAVTPYVAPNGNDDWSGKLDATGPDGDGGPLATLSAAWDRVRVTRKTDPFTPVTVTLRGGVYFLDAPFTLTPADSGSETAPVVYAAYPNETPILSAGERIGGWRTAEVNGRQVWTTHLPDVGREGRRPRQLFVNCERRFCARSPNEGWSHTQELPDVTDETP